MAPAFNKPGPDSASTVPAPESKNDWNILALVDTTELRIVPVALLSYKYFVLKEAQYQGCIMMSIKAEV